MELKTEIKTYKVVQDLQLPSVKSIEPERKIAHLATEKLPKSKFPLNATEVEIINCVLRGESVVIVGPAGSGKTTTVLGKVLPTILEAGVTLDDNPLYKAGKPHPRREGNPIAIHLCSYTHAAVGVTKSHLPAEFTVSLVDHFGKSIREEKRVVTSRIISTVHGLLQYVPNNAEGVDVDNVTKTFVPSRTESNPLPYLQYIFIDEAGQLPIELLSQIIDALPAKTCFIISGDIMQTDAVASMSSLKVACTYCKNVFYLSSVYRQQGSLLRAVNDIRCGTFASFDYKFGQLCRHPEYDSVFFWAIDDTKKSPVEINMETANVMFQLWKKGIINLGSSKLLCPQYPQSAEGKVDKYGIYGIQQGLDMFIDTYTGRRQYLIGAGSHSLMVMAVGDFYNVNTYSGRNTFMVVNISKNRLFIGDRLLPSRYRTRNPSLWHEQYMRDHADEALLLPNIEHTTPDILFDESEVDDITKADIEALSSTRSPYVVHLLNMTVIRALLGSTYKHEHYLDVENMLVNEIQTMILRLENAEIDMDWYTLKANIVNILHSHGLSNAELLEAMSNNDLFMSATSGAVTATFMPVMTTVQAAQGTQASTVIFACSIKHSRGVNRNILYTAASRAQDRLIVVGSPDSFGYMEKYRYMVAHPIFRGVQNINNATELLSYCKEKVSATLTSNTHDVPFIHNVAKYLRS